ncbi:MAG: lipoyl domain-containing protein [bacterium]|nr:lipoyl domain-containing protein [bacterium]MXY76585.1 biotin attachment protein [Acidimicrobiia bacterium]MYF84289.1 biotin attachment protein [Acidimicrobiia bacterium]
MQVILPKWGVSMQDAVLIRWLKAVGAPVVKGEPLAEFETDKVEVELESPASGVLTRVYASEDDIVDVGAVIAEIQETP